MKKRIIKKLIIGSITIGMISIFAMNLLSEKIFNVIKVEEINQEVQEIVAQAGDIKNTVATPSSSGYSQKTTITGGNINGAATGQQYTYFPGTYCGGHLWKIDRRKTYEGGGLQIVDQAGAARILQPLSIARTYAAGNARIAYSGGSGRKQQTTYTWKKTTEMAQSIAYGKIFGATDKQVNQLI